MKHKTVLAWLIGLALAGGVVLLYSSNLKKSVQLETLQAQMHALVSQLEQSEREKNEKLQAQQEEIVRLRKDNQELLRLRNEIRQVREEKDQLARQAQLAQAQAQRAQAQVAAAQSQIEALKTNVPPPVAPAPVQPQVVLDQDQHAKALMCINNLRRLDAAKQQWALENRKLLTAVPTPQELLPYLGPAGFPTCAAGGTYTLNQVNLAPACSIPGHVLQ